MTRYILPFTILDMALEQKIRIAMIKKGIKSLSELAGRMNNCSPQNLHNKLKRDNFDEKEMREIAEALGADLRIEFVDKETGEVL